MQPSHDAIQALADSVKRLIEHSQNSIEGFTMDNLCLGDVNNLSGYYVSVHNLCNL